MPLVNEMNQQEVTSLISEITDRVKRLDLIIQGLTTQDRMLAGAVAFGMYNPWTETESFHFVGNIVMIPIVLNKMLDMFRKGLQVHPGSPKLYVDPIHLD